MTLSVFQNCASINEKSLCYVVFPILNKYFWNDLKKSFWNSKNKPLTNFGVLNFSIIQLLVTTGLNLNNIFNIFKVEISK